MLPVITRVMEGMTLPLALCIYTAMGIAGSGMKETTKNCLTWRISSMKKIANVLNKIFGEVY